ncbi:hypothetical protein EMA8858_01477 [Emticicia aquatica]|jgi:hypothetical protein|uniref:Uncharacterized protein n=1 Tax=Emticicia aquatica TaxID=1681835 RepID=A0ABM9AQ07_9BACT|nr:hypothetical protein [Emticicia aquatica]CAH0995356.1 hypothetical protein EMA8858_01477 [Emticicia aquatica]
MKKLIPVAFLSLLISCQSSEEKKENKSDSVATATTQSVTQSPETLTFGFSNENGDKILAFEENFDPKTTSKTIDSEGNIVSIKFTKKQPVGPNGGVNLTSFNFDDCAGSIFEITGGQKANSAFTSILMNDVFLKNHQQIQVKTFEKPQNIDNISRNKIEIDRKRKIKSAWQIANLDTDLKAFIVIFVPKKDSVLASLVIGNNEFIYRDYPAKYDEGSTWRVDDGGEFSNDAIRILAAFRNQQKDIEIITEWAGAEGANIEYCKTNKNKFETIKEASRYWGAN